MLTIAQIKKACETVATEYPITRMELFGSYANGTNTPQSDVDILVEFNTRSVSLITLSGLKIRLEELLQTPVDVIHAPIPKDSILEIDNMILMYAV